MYLDKAVRQLRRPEGRAATLTGCADAFFALSDLLTQHVIRYHASMVLRGQDAWRKHPAVSNNLGWRALGGRRALPAGVALAVSIILLENIFGSNDHH